MHRGGTCSSAFCHCDDNDVLKGGQDSTLLGGSGDDALCGRVNTIKAMDGGAGWDTICLDAEVVSNAEEITCDPCPNGF
jgi:Ca2+-binding RTX toxin-like protein